mgnify:CR=1 FL=1
MNKVYKTVWNALRHCLVVVSEATKSASQRGSTSYAQGSEIGVSSPMKSVGFKHSKLALITLCLISCFGTAYAKTGHVEIASDKTVVNGEVSAGGYIWVREGVTLTMKNSKVELHGNSGDYPIHNDILENKGSIYFTGSNGGIRYYQGKYYYDVYAQNYNYMEFAQGSSLQSTTSLMNTQNFSSGTMVFDNGSINMTAGKFSNEGQLILRNNSTAKVTTAFVNTGTITLDSGSTFTTSKLNSDNGSVVLRGGSLNIDSNSVIKSLEFVGGTLKNGSAQNLTASSGKGTLNQNSYTANSLLTVTGGTNSGNIYSNNGLTVNGSITNNGYWKVANSLNFGGNGKFNQNLGTLEIVGDNLLFTDSEAWKPELSTISLSSQVPDEINTITTEYFMRFLPGEVREELKGHLSVSGNGVVKVTGVNLTTTERDALVSAFKETFFIRFPKAFPQLSVLWLWA